jgi:hypothetical protein
MTSHHKTGGKRAEHLAYATVTISGEDLDPDAWTAYFGVEPEISVVKGRPFRTPSGRMSTYPGRTGVWGCSSKSTVTADSLDPHIKYLVGLLGLPRSDLPCLLAHSHAKMRLFCFWSNYAGDRVPVIDTALKSVIESSGATIEIDEYPPREPSVII